MANRTRRWRRPVEALFERAAVLEIIQKSGAISDAVRIFSRPLPPDTGFPRTILCSVAGTEFATREFFDNALPVALAGSFAAKPAVEEGLHADRENDTRRLHAHREASRVELRDRLPRHDLVKVIKRHTEQAFELLTRPERMPLGMRETGSRVAEVLECDDDPAVLVPDAEIALSFEPRAWHLATLCGGQRTKRKEFYAGSGRGCGSRAPVNRRGGGYPSTHFLATPQAWPGFPRTDSMSRDQRRIPAASSLR